MRTEGHGPYYIGLLGVFRAMANFSALTFKESQQTERLENASWTHALRNRIVVIGRMLGPTPEIREIPRAPLGSVCTYKPLTSPATGEHRSCRVKEREKDSPWHFSFWDCITFPLSILISCIPSDEMLSRGIRQSLISTPFRSV